MNEKVGNERTNPQRNVCNKIHNIYIIFIHEHWNRSKITRKSFWSRSFRLGSQHYSYFLISLWTSWSTTGTQQLQTWDALFLLSKELSQHKHVWSFLCLYAFMQVYVAMWPYMRKIFFHQPQSHHWGLPKGAERNDIRGIYCPRNDGPKATTIP